MTQMWTTLGVRLARAGLWLVIIGVPLAYCLLPLLVVIVLAGTPVEQSDTYIAGQLMRLVAPPTPIWQNLLRAGTSLAYLAWPVLLAVGAGYLLLAGSAQLGRRYWPQWHLRPSSTLWRWGGRLLALLAIAYVVGCLLHLLLPAKLWNPVELFSRSSGPRLPNFPPIEWMREEYWWPYSQPSATAMQGYTIYSPIYMAALEFQSIKAVCIKLGALLATLLVYHRLASSTISRPVASV